MNISNKTEILNDLRKKQEKRGKNIEKKRRKTAVFEELNCYKPIISRVDKKEKKKNLSYNKSL